MLFRKSEVEQLAERLGVDRAKVILKLIDPDEAEKAMKVLEFYQVLYPILDKVLAIRADLEERSAEELKSILMLHSIIESRLEANDIEPNPDRVLTLVNNAITLERLLKADLYSITFAPRKNRFYINGKLENVLKVAPFLKGHKPVMHSSKKFALSEMGWGVLRETFQEP